MRNKCFAKVMHCDEGGNLRKIHSITM